jgi:hypothetical protein
MPELRNGLFPKEVNRQVERSTWLEYTSIYETKEG